MLAPTSGFGLCANTSALGFAAHSFAMAMSITDSGSKRIADSRMLRWTTYCLTSLPPYTQKAGEKGQVQWFIG